MDEMTAYIYTNENNDSKQYKVLKKNCKRKLMNCMVDIVLEVDY